jgi:hypothetical protein
LLLALFLAEGTASLHFLSFFEKKKTVQCGYSLWLVGAFAPIAQPTYFKISKTLLKKYLDVHPDILNYHEKKIFLCLVLNTILGTLN